MPRILVAALLVFSACATTQSANPPATSASGEWQGWNAAANTNDAPASNPSEWAEWQPIDDTPLSSLPDSLAADVDEASGEDGFSPVSSEAVRAAGARRGADAGTAPSRQPLQAGTKTGRFVAATASRWVGLKSLRRISKRVPDDCSGLVRLSYHKAGLDPVAYDGRPNDNAVTAMWRRAYRLGALKRGAPKPGDLVFFRNTWDRNGDGKRNDGLTHVGVVERVDAHGTVSFVHRSGQGVNRMRLNTKHPSLKKSAEGRPLNDWLRRPDGTNGPRLTGELFAGYASVNAFKKEPLRVARKRVARAR